MLSSNAMEGAKKALEAAGKETAEASSKQIETEAELAAASADL